MITTLCWTSDLAYSAPSGALYAGNWISVITGYKTMARPLNPPRGSRNGQAKLNDAAVAYIKRWNRTEAPKELASMFNLHVATINRVIARDSWVSV